MGSALCRPNYLNNGEKFEREIIDEISSCFVVSFGSLHFHVAFFLPFVPWEGNESKVCKKSSGGKR